MFAYFKTKLLPLGKYSTFMFWMNDAHQRNIVSLKHYLPIYF